MSRLDKLSPALLQQIGAAIDDRLTNEELAQLEARLSADPNAMEVYWDMSQLAMDLHTRERTRRATRVGLAAVEAAVQSEGESATKLAATSITPNSPTPRFRSWLDHASARPKWTSIVVASLVVAVGLGWAAVTYVSDRVAIDRQKPTREAEFVAWYMGAHDAKWLDDTEPKQTRLKPGQLLAISQGVIEIHYMSGAEVVIEGPAKFYVGDKTQTKDKDNAANRGFLARGRLVARVEGKKAKGFTINTPSGLVTDLGTEFGAEVRSDHRVDVEVFDGEIRVASYAADGSAYVGQVVKAGQTVMLRKGISRSTIIRTPAVPSRFVRDLRKYERGISSETVLVTPVSGSIYDAGSGADKGTATQLIDGSGLAGTLTLENYSTITHDQMFAGNCYISKQMGPDFFVAGTPPTFEFDLGRIYKISHFVSWGAIAASRLHDNEAKSFLLEFSTDHNSFSDSQELSARTHGGDGYTNGPQGFASTMRLSRKVAARYVRVTPTDNWYDTSAPGGDHVFMTEIRFLAELSSDNSAASHRDVQSIKKEVVPEGIE